MARIGRNDPCPCGSGKKHKKCCLAQGASLGTASADVSGPAEHGDAVEHLEGIDELIAQYFEARDLDEAEAIGHEMLRRYPDHIDGHERLGEVYEARGALLKAAESFRLAAERMTPAEPNYDPGYVPFLLYRAEQLVRRARGAVPSDFDETSDSVACDVVRGEFDRAEQGILELALRRPEHYAAHERRGQLCEALRDFAGAARHFRLAAERAIACGADPAHVGYLRRRADVLDPPSMPVS